MAARMRIESKVRSLASIFLPAKNLMGSRCSAGAEIMQREISNNGRGAPRLHAWLDRIK
jgi:hypothetical protein